jgi:hypothetical protein
MQYFSLWRIILKPLSWLRTPPSYRRMKYFIRGPQLFCVNQKPISNTRIIFRNLQFTKNELLGAIRIYEEMYLLILHEDNIAHFFHDIFFPLYIIWREHKKKIFVSINANQFQRDFLISAIGSEYLMFAEPNTPYAFQDLILVPEGRDLQEYPNFEEVCKEIKYACFLRNGIQESRSRNIIYGRNELERKNLLGIDRHFLSENSIEMVQLSKLSFSETVALLSETKNFIYMVGAGVFYLLFLDQTVKVLEINPVRNNSWAQMFGLSQLCNLEVLISQNIKNTALAMQSDAALDSHVVFDDIIKEKIIALL